MNSAASYEQIHSSVVSTNALALCIQTAQVHFNMDKPMSYYVNDTLMLNRRMKNNTEWKSSFCTLHQWMGLKDDEMEWGKTQPRHKWGNVIEMVFKKQGENGL